MDDLDRIFLSEDPLVPPARFAASVMEAVEAPAAEPPPFPFPWHRFAAGAAGCVLWAASCVWWLDLAAASAAEVVSKLGTVRMPLEYAAVAVFVCLGALAVRRSGAELRAI